MNSTSARFLPTIAVLLLSAAPAFAQRSRITEPIRSTKRAILSGHTPAQARAEYDRGRAAADLELRSLSLVLQPSGAQQAALDKLLAEQQDPASPNFHRWLTPEEYADRFGLSQADLDKIAAWLSSNGLTVTGAARARNSITFRGTAQQVEAAFATEIHQYLVDGEIHFSNATDPSLPEALQGIVRAVHGLNDFRMQPRRAVRRPAPRYTSGTGRHYLAPDDFAAIYNVQSLYDAGLGGAGQKIVVVGQTRIDVADIQQFRTAYGLPPSDPQIVLVPNLRDPGTSKTDLPEADLDIQWAGAVARDATIVYVYSFNVTDAVQYAIDQNLAPVLSMSYGFCEAQSSASEAQVYRSWARQANAQGMTWVTASGDSGGADCATSFTNGGRLSVDLPGAVPEVTSVGGTTLNEGSGTYWNSSNSSTKASAIGYIPETAWNDSVSDGSPSSGGGGVSTIFAKPTWQTGAGVPDDGFRDVPDLSMAASASHDGYLTYSGGTLSVVGGTSVSAPVVAGITALLNQRLVATGAQLSPGIGNINAKLYSLAQSAPGAFHDVITGDNKVEITCGLRARNCVSGVYGYAAGPGYDQATGLGTLDAYQFVMAWSNTAPRNVSPAIAGMANGASFVKAFAPGMLLSVFGTQLSIGTAAAASLPLPTQLAGVTASVNGVTAPLYYVSPGQINLQVPDSLPPGPATVAINNNGQTASATITLAAAAPGIFASAMPASAKRGDILTLYLTGAGNFQTLSVTIGGVSAAISYAAVPPGLVGVVQVNYQVPPQAPTGVQPVVVTVSGVSSPPVTMQIQ